MFFSVCSLCGFFLFFFYFVIITLECLAKGGGRRGGIRAGRRKEGKGSLVGEHVVESEKDIKFLFFFQFKMFFA